MPPLRRASITRCEASIKSSEFECLCGESELLIALNMSSEPRRLETAHTNQILLSTYLDRDGCCETSIMLRTNEGLILGSSP